MRWIRAENCQFERWKRREAIDGTAIAGRRCEGNDIVLLSFTTVSIAGKLSLSLCDHSSSSIYHVYENSLVSLPARLYACMLTHEPTGKTSLEVTWSTSDHHPRSSMTWLRKSSLTLQPYSSPGTVPRDVTEYSRYKVLAPVSTYPLTLFPKYESHRNERHSWQSPLHGPSTTSSLSCKTSLDHMQPNAFGPKSS